MFQNGNGIYRVFLIYAVCVYFGYLAFYVSFIPM